MPGANCCFPQCTNSRYERKTKTVGTEVENKTNFFAITVRKGDFYAKWRENTLSIVKRHREDIDSNFIEKMMKGQKWICSLHYKPEDIETTDGIKLLQRPRLVPGALPSLNLPIRSHEPTPCVERRPLTIVREHVICILVVLILSRYRHGKSKNEKRGLLYLRNLNLPTSSQSFKFL